MPGQLAERHELLEREGERCLIEIRPDGAAAPAVFPVELHGFLASPLRCQHIEVAQPAAELVFAHLVVLRPRVEVLDDELLGTSLAELLWYPGISLRTFGEPLPDVRPAGLARA